MQSRCCRNPAGTFASRADLLQFYANVGAWPHDSTTREPIPLPPSQSDLPSYPNIDWFQSLDSIIVRTLGFGEWLGVCCFRSG